MSPRALLLHWSTDGSLGLGLGLLLGAGGGLYLLAARTGARRNRRGRVWPRRRTVSFMAGLAVLAVDLYSGLGAQADVRLSAHMLQHMVMWTVAAPLLAAGAPIRLAFFALRRGERMTLAGWLRTPVVRALSTPAGAAGAFTAVLAASHIPAVYDLALRAPGVHAGEHALYLFTALLVWAPIIGADPLPHRPGPRGRAACLAACMVPMLVLGAWLAAAAGPVYPHYAHTLGAGALADQRLAGVIMWAGCLPALAVPVLQRALAPRRQLGGLAPERVPA